MCMNVTFDENGLPIRGPLTLADYLSGAVNIGFLVIVIYSVSLILIGSYEVFVRKNKNQPSAKHQIKKGLIILPVTVIIWFLIWLLITLLNSKLC
jgi:hypothetical protein